MESFKVHEGGFHFQLVSSVTRKDRFILEGRYERKIIPGFPSNARVTPPMQYLSSTELERASEDFQKITGFFKSLLYRLLYFAWQSL